MRPLILLHGAMDSLRQFDAVVPLLSPYFELYRFNFSGHGNRPFSPSFGITTFTEEVLNFMNREGIGEADIFGYDMGGYVALNLIRLYPSKIGKVFTLGTRFHWTPEAAGKTIGHLEADLVPEEAPALTLGSHSSHAPADRKLLFEKTRACLEALGRDNMLKPADLRKIPHQVLVAVGDSDEWISVEETEAIVQTLPNGKLLILQNSAHPLESVDQEALVEEILEFF